MKNMLSKLNNGTGKLCFAGALSSFLASSEPNFWSTMWTLIKARFVDMFLPLLELVAQLILFVYKWMLVIIDFGFVLIRQMCGMNTDYSSFESVIDGDIIFKFIFDEKILELMRDLTFFAIVIIIILAIIAIIKSEFVAVADGNNTGEIKNDKSKIWKSIFESCLLLVLVPIVTFGGMILSNAVLQTLYNATRNGSDMSVGAGIFAASTYTANSYRQYANANQKIPITYKFQQIVDYTAVTDWDSSGSVDQIATALEKYKQANEWTQGYATFEMFYLDQFFNMDTIDYYTINDPNNAYQAVYDAGINTYKYEYYVNADLQDYLMRYSHEAYFLTAEEVYESCQSVGKQLNIAYEPDAHGGKGVYEFSIDYADDKDPIMYKHVEGSTDEANGAVFIVCVQKSVKQDGETRYYYEPLTSANTRFNSEYLGNTPQYIVAKGFFDEGKFPTAIKKTGGKVSFYRDVLNVPTLGTFLPHISYEIPSGVVQEPATAILRSAVDLFTGIDISDFIPYVYFEIDLMNLFDKSTRNVTTLENGGYHLDYVFSSQGMAIQHIYLPYTINFLVLILGTGVVLAKLLPAFFGLFKRFVDIIFLYLTYPAAVATIPLFGKSSFSKWVKNMVGKVISMYGLILGLHLSFMLITVSSSISLFTVQDLQHTFLSVITQDTLPFFNMLFQLLFYLVGVTYIFGAGKTIQALITDDKTVPDIVADGESLTKNVKGVYEKARDVVSGKVLLNSVKNITGYTDPKTGQYTPGFIPGSALIGAMSQRKETKFGMNEAQSQHDAKSAELNKKKGENAAAIKDAINSAKSAKGSK